MASDIVITPNRGSTTVNAKIDFTGASTASSQIRLEVLPDNSLSFVGTTGSLFSIADSVTGSLMSVNDASGLPILEVFDTDKVVMGQYNQNTLVVNGTNVGIGTGSPNSKLEIRGGTANQTYDATVYITADNDNDWALVVDKNRSAASEYGLRIITGSAASYALAVYGGGSLSTRIAGNGDIYAPRMYDSTATTYYVDPGSTSNLNGLTVAGAITGTLSGNATTATTATNWGSYGAVPAAGTSFATANTIGRSDGNGYTFFGYINSNVANNENGTVSQFIITNGSDNYFRKASLAHVKSQMSLNNVENTALSTWAGSIYITTLGTISAGTWNGSIIGPTYGGTGINNGSRTLTINTNAGTIAFSAASTTLTVANNASVSGTNTGDQTTVSGNAGTATTWQTARTLTIGATGKSVNGSADVSWTVAEIQAAAGTPSAQSLNFDTIKIPGLYQYDGTIGATKPPDGSPNYRTIEIGNNTRYTQIALPWDSDNMYFRRQNSVGWQTWRTVIHDGNYTSYVGNGTLTLAVSGSGLSGSASFTANQSGNTTFTVTSNATASNTASTIMLRGSSNEVYIGDVYSSNWFRNVGANGLYNSDHTMHWYAEAGYYNVAGGGSLTYGGIKFRAGHASTFKGSTYWDADGFGLLNQGGNWAVRINAASGYAGGSLYGVWDKRNASNTGTSVAIPGMFVQAGSTGAPSAIQNGDLWWNTETGKLKIWYSTSSAWVDATSVPDLANYFPVAGGNITGNVSIGGLLNTTGNITARNGQTYPVSIGSHPSYGANYSAVWRPSQDYALLFDSGSTFLNASSTVHLRVGNTSYATINTSGITVNGNAFFTSNYGHGIVGLYNAARYQGVFAMGDSYKLAADGTTTGSLYGIAWSHPNAGGVAANLNTHGALVMENGTFLAAISGSIRCRDDMRAPIFYDSNDTNYYVDPASTSRVNTISFVSGATFGPYFQYGNVAQNLRLQGGSGSEIGISGYDFNGNWRFQLYGQSGAYGFLNGNWAGWDLQKNTSGNLYLNNQTTYYIGTNEIYYNRVYGLADIRSPIFYDNDNTGYYCNPAGTSQFLQLDVVNSIGASDDVRSGTRMYDSAGMAAGVGGQLVLGYKYTTAGAYTEGAILKTYKINATDGNYGSGLKIQVRNHGENLATKVQIDGSGNMVIGGNMTNNSYDSVGSTRLLFGGGNDPNSYFIGTNLNNYGGNYTKLDLRWHTGIRMGARPGYGGIRIFSDETVGTRIASFGETDSHVRIDNNLYVGQIIDISNSTYYVDPASSSRLNGGIQLDGSLGVGTAGSGTAGEIRATNNITAYYSDDRLKTKLGIIENPIEKVKALSGFYFEANETAVALGYQKKREVGVSAQEVQAILPEIIAPAPIDDKYMTVRYEKLIPLLIEAIKAQQAQIEELQKLIKEKA